ncbi:MAG: thiosulfate oxidation carrier complex protein SoxZ [Epsilonproteobacteria bacterium]|nr:MAG: thiosulfate oxidation carrier complex protein SoxZ [Campylobacterota bacterium]
MATKKTRIKAKAKNGIVTVMALAKHPMYSGAEAKKLKVKQNFITYLKAEVSGKIVYEVTSSQFFSKNPYLKFKYKGNKGDEIVISWVDLLGNKNTSKSKAK